MDVSWFCLAILVSPKIRINGFGGDTPNNPETIEMNVLGLFYKQIQE